MNSSKFRLTLDLHSIQSQYSIPVMVGDTSVTLLISITDGGVPYKIEDGCYARISIKRPNGTKLEDVCAIRNNAIIEYHFAEDGTTCAMEGVHHCDITLFNGKGARVGSPWFTMVVSEKVVRSDDLEISLDDQTLIDSYAAEEVKRREAEAERVAAENERAEAETVRNNHEDDRCVNEEERDEYERWRREAEKTRISNENERVAKDAERDSKINEAVNKSNYAADTADEALFQAENALNAAGIAKTNSIIAETNARYAMDQTDTTRTSLINLTAQVEGIGRTYVIPTFSLFIDFLKDDYSIALKEDRDGDGADETYNIKVNDLKSGDNLIITEHGVPDFWFEKNMALVEFETYLYNGYEYSLGSIVGGVTVGGAHVLETDYTVIEGHAISAEASANEARGYAFDAGMAKTNAEEAAEEAGKERKRATEAVDLAVDVLSNAANALKGKKRGGAVAMSDISPLEHTLDVRVRSKNLIPYPYNETSKEQGGLTWTINNDRSITVSGTPTINFVAFQLSDIDVFEEGKTYYLSEYLLVSCRTPSGTKWFGGGVGIYTLKWEKNYSLGQIYYQVAQTEEAVNRTYYPFIVEAADTAEYTPYVADVSAVKVKKQGKNLSAINELTLSGYMTTALYRGRITTPLALSWKQDFDRRSGAALFGVYSGDGYVQYAAYGEKAGSHSVTINVVDGDAEIQVINYALETGRIYDIQIEVGDTTEYEPYIEPVEYAVNEDGTVEGVLPIYPTTTLMTDTAGAVIDIEYNRDINKAFAELYNAIISLGGNV